MFRESIHKSNFYQCEETNCLTICQTETRHQQIRKNADKIWILSRGYQNNVKIPHQMSLFNKHQKQVHLQKWVKINRIIRKLHLPSPNNVSTRTYSKKFHNKYCFIPQTELKIHKRESVTSASSSKPKRIFQFYNAKHLYCREKQRLTGRTWLITPPHNITHI
jgi:hypothetical protein